MSTSASLPYAHTAASRNPQRAHFPESGSPEWVATADWKAELNARLRDHRSRRGEAAQPAAPETLQGYRRANGELSPASVAARVAERYRGAPTYGELLAQHALAEKLLHASAAAAQTAAETALQAQAAAEAALRTWDWDQDCDHKPGREQRAAGNACSGGRSPDTRCSDHAAAATPMQGEAPGAFEIEHHAPLPARHTVPERAATGSRARMLVDAFAEAVVPAAQSLPAKLIEFPRELIASRKQRPRLAEGPLYEQESSSVSLRIFEVETGVHPLGGAAEESTHDPEALHRAGNDSGHGVNDRDPYEQGPVGRRGSFLSGGGASRPERSGWESIRLDEHPSVESQAVPAVEESYPLPLPEHGYPERSLPALHDLAPIQLRLMAALLDGGLVFGSFLIAVLVFVSCTAHAPSGKAACVVALLALGVLATFYGWLFMSFGGGSTPGMRYARIALCTFADENPTRRELQSRVPATALALLPLGLGVFWAMLDEERLGWHDRMTRTYQRSYK